MRFGFSGSNPRWPFRCPATSRVSWKSAAPHRRRGTDTHPEREAFPFVPDSAKKIQSRKAAQLSLFSVVSNVVLAGVKGVAGVLGNSYALIADAIESTMDVFSSLVVWGGLRIAAVPADDEHPYGHGKAESLAAVVIALSLVIAAIGIAVESIGEILEPGKPPAKFTLAVLLGVVFFKEGMFRFLHRGGREVGSTALQTDAWHHRSDAITSAAAFVGISFAIMGGEGYEAADDWAALLACGIIAFNGIRLLRGAIWELMDAAPDPAIEERVRSAALATDDVEDLDVCLVRKMGLVYFVDLHVCVDGGISVREGHRIAHRVKDAIRKQVPVVEDVLIHIEPAEAD